MAERRGRLSHVDASGRARMVNVGRKRPTLREAEAEGRVRLGVRAFRLLLENRMEKGDVLGVARLAGIQAAKRTAEWIPLCHAVPLDWVEVRFRMEPRLRSVRVIARASARWTTGVEMEALTAVAGAALAIYDMCKAADRGIEIEAIRLILKRGGRSGEYRASAPRGRP